VKHQVKSLRPPAARLRGDGPSRHLTLPLLESIAGLAHAYTVNGSEPRAVLHAVLGPTAPLCTLRQVHGATVRRVDNDPGSGREASPLDGDALMTDRAGLALAVWSADCVPVLVCDPRTRALAAVHAGWRGTVVGVLTAAIGALRDGFGCRPGDLRIGLGPAIGPCCYEVGEEVVAALLRADPGARRCVLGSVRHRVDLVGANVRQAVAAGVPSGRIEAVGLCTACHADLLPSFRRDGRAAGRIAALVGWVGL
jgi:YfiH family protein